MKKYSVKFLYIISKIIYDVLYIVRTVQYMKEVGVDVDCIKTQGLIIARYILSVFQKIPESVQKN